jgi:hypothetical protein
VQLDDEDGYRVYPVGVTCEQVRLESIDIDLDDERLAVAQVGPVEEGSERDYVGVTAVQCNDAIGIVAALAGVDDSASAIAAADGAIEYLDAGANSVSDGELRIGRVPPQSR